MGVLFQLDIYQKKGALQRRLLYSVNENCLLERLFAFANKDSVSFKLAQLAHQNSSEIREARYAF